MKYPKIEENEWVQPVRKGYRMKCCKCGVVHYLDFRFKKKGRSHFIQFRAYVDK